MDTLISTSNRPGMTVYNSFLSQQRTKFTCDRKEVVTIAEKYKEYGQSFIRIIEKLGTMWDGFSGKNHGAEHLIELESSNHRSIHFTPYRTELKAEDL